MEKAVRPPKKEPFLTAEEIEELFNAVNPDRQKMGPVRRKLSKLRGSFERYVDNQKMKRLTKIAQQHTKKPEFLTPEEIMHLLNAVQQGAENTHADDDRTM